jgi:hypothetical protein
MPASIFSDLAFLWPFANQLDQTTIIYKETKRHTKVRPHIPPNDIIATSNISAALGRISMDKSLPDFYLVGQMDEQYEANKNHKNLIYIGGKLNNEVVKAFIEEYDRKSNYKRVVELPSRNLLPRTIKIMNRKIKTEYYDSQHKYVKTDYGLIFLCSNPFSSNINDRLNALLLAGLHSYGTLAAARTISDPIFSAEICQRIIANFHMPPHLLGTIEIVVQSNIDENGNCIYLPPEQSIRCVYVNGKLLHPIDSDTDNRRPYFVDFTSGTNSQIFSIKREQNSLKVSFDPKFDSSEIAAPMTNAQGLILSVDLDYLDGLDKEQISDDLLKKIHEHNHTIKFSEDLTIAIEQQGFAWLLIDKCKNKSYSIRKENDKLNIYTDKLSKLFFEYFSERTVVIISPHSDDSVIACGGLIYYLRNRKLWEAHGRNNCPPVEILVITESPGGVEPDYFEKYCSYIGTFMGLNDETIKNELEKRGLKEKEIEEEFIKRINAIKSQIRCCESRSEATLLSANSKWLQFPRDIVEKSSNFLLSISPILEKILDENKNQHPLILMPCFEDQHHTHTNITKSMLDSIRHWPTKLLDNAEIWLYESPWANLDTSAINVVLPLDKHATFAKMQAISMHQSQQIRTKFSEVALARSKYLAEVLPESLLGGFGSGGFSWDRVEIFSSVNWKMLDFSSNSNNSHSY